jgi:hypothetical protein
MPSNLATTSLFALKHTYPGGIMIPLSHDRPHDQLPHAQLPHDQLPADQFDATPQDWSDGAFLRLHWQPDEEVKGWVTAEITPYPRPLVSLNAPYEAQFVLAVVEYPSGLARQSGRLHWRAVDIVLRSDRAWPVFMDGESAPQLTPELQELVDELAQQAQSLGWEPAGRGRTWCSLRFRMPYEQIRGRLQRR